MYLQIPRQGIKLMKAEDLSGMALYIGKANLHWPNHLVKLLGRIFIFPFFHHLTIIFRIYLLNDIIKFGFLALITLF